MNRCAECHKSHAIKFSTYFLHRRSIDWSTICFYCFHLVDERSRVGCIWIYEIAMNKFTQPWWIHNWLLTVSHDWRTADWLSNWKHECTRARADRWHNNTRDDIEVLMMISWPLPMPIKIVSHKLHICLDDRRCEHQMWRTCKWWLSGRSQRRHSGRLRAAARYTGQWRKKEYVKP